MRRADKRFPLTSPQVERESRRTHQGGARLEGGPRERRPRRPRRAADERGVLFLRQGAGPGGLPTGTAGRVACLLSGGIDSPVAAHRMMKRGCAVTFVHFHSYPILSRASQEKARELVALLTRWQLRSRLYLVPFGDIQQQVVLSVPAPMRVVVYQAPDDADCGTDRARARRAGARHRRRRRAGRVADAREPRRSSAAWPRCRCSGRSSAWTRRRSPPRRQSSAAIRFPSFPDQDCCTLFTPRHPQTRARLHADRGCGVGAADRRLGRRARCADAVVEDFQFPMVGSRTRGAQWTVVAGH